MSATLTVPGMLRVYPCTQPIGVPVRAAWPGWSCNSGCRIHQYRPARRSATYINAFRLSPWQRIPPETANTGSRITPVYDGTLWHFARCQSSVQPGPRGDICPTRGFSWIRTVRDTRKRPAGIPENGPVRSGSPVRRSSRAGRLTVFRVRLSESSPVGACRCPYRLVRVCRVPR